MRSIHYFFAAFLFLTSAVANAQSSNSKYSPRLMQWLNVSSNHYQKPEGVMNTVDNVSYVSILVKVNKNVDESGIKNLGGYIGTKAGNIWTIRIPESQVQHFIHLTGIDYIELDRPLVRQMDSARYATHADSVQEGINLPSPLSGKGVVIGIIDLGFDYAHPAFYDTTGKTLRIKRVWDQTAEGAPPAGYTYGNEYTDTSTMIAKKYDMTIETHATHVSGIAAGSGNGSPDNRAYRGMAYESDLVFVTNPPNVAEWRSMTIGSVIDGISYIFNYAQSQGKAAVINLSQGSQLGPHDGSSLFSQACDNLVGPGRILVFSAGNDAQSKVHLRKDFSPTDTIVKTFLTCPFVSDSVKKNNMEIWGDTTNTFCFQVGLYHDSTEVSSTRLFCLDDSVHNVYIIGSDNDTCFVEVTTKTVQYNKKRYADIEVQSRSSDTLCLTIKGVGGQTDVWQEFFDSTWVGFTGDFLKKGISWATEGDNSYSIGEVACTKSVITVGGYVTRRNWSNLSGAEYDIEADTDGDIVNFSSHGPTIDGRMKPDICAPASMIASSLNSYDPDFLPGGADYFFDVWGYHSFLRNRIFYYGVLEGTSMASPMVTGIIAMMLQVNPSLWPDEAKTILYETALRDSFTTPYPDSTTWGAGKINAYAAVKRAIQTVGINNIALDSGTIDLYPNPSAGSFTLRCEATRRSFLYIEVTNLFGQLVKSQPWQVNEGVNELPVEMITSKGMYFVTVFGSGSQVAKRIVLQ